MAAVLTLARTAFAISQDGKTLYSQAMKGRTLYSLPTDALTGFSQKGLPETLSDKVLADRVVTVGENGPADGLIIGQDGKMYVSSPQDDSVKVRDLSASGATLTVLLQDKQLRWPDTFTQAEDGTVYVTTSHIQDSAMFKLGAPIALPSELWSFRPAGG